MRFRVLIADDHVAEDWGKTRGLRIEEVEIVTFHQPTMAEAENHLRWLGMLERV